MKRCPRCDGEITGFPSRVRIKLAEERKVQADRGAVLAKAIKRLVGGPCPFLADLLTPEERKAAGLPSVKKARAS